MLGSVGRNRTLSAFLPALSLSRCQAFRESIQTIDKLSAVSLKPEGEEASSLRELATAWSAISKAHRIHSMHEDKVIFPVLDSFFPGQVCSLLVWNACKGRRRVLV